MRVVSPVPWGCGAYILHSMLQESLPGYLTCPYHPLRELFPPLIYPVGRSLEADIVHAIVDHAVLSARRDVPLVATFHGYFLDDELRSYNSFV